MTEFAVVTIILIVCCFLFTILFAFLSFCTSLYLKEKPKFRHKAEIDIEKKKFKSDLDFDTKK